MSEYNAPTNQIAAYQTSTKVLSAYDKLKAAPARRYGEIHAKNLTIEDRGYKRRLNSLVQLRLQDHQRGAGDNSSKVYFNLEPEILQFIKTRVECGYLEYSYENTKIFGEPDASGRSTAQKIVINRNQVDKNGNEARYPWYIFISNGTGVRAQNKAGGYYMAGNSYIAKAEVFINLTDMDMFCFLQRIDSFIKCWENAQSMKTMLEGIRLYEEAVRTRPQGEPENYVNPYQNIPSPYDAQASYYNTGYPVQNTAPGTATPPFGDNQTITRDTQTYAVNNQAVQQAGSGFPMPPMPPM